MLGIIKNFAAVFLKEVHRIRDHRQIFFQACFDNIGHVQVPAFSKDGTRRRVGFDQLI